MPGALRTRKMSDPLVPVVTEGCEHHKGTGELNPDLLEEQPVLITTEPSLQPQGKTLLKASQFHA